MILRSGKEVELSTAFLEELDKVYYNVQQEVAKARIWLLANPAKRPEKNIKRFIVNWLNRQPELLRPMTKQLVVTDIVPETNLAVARAAISKAREILRNG